MACIKKNNKRIKPADPESRDKLLQHAEAIIKTALAEDVGSGDITTTATVAKGKRGVCRLIAKQDLILAGFFFVEGVFRQVDKRIKLRPLAEDGARVKKGGVIAELRGPLAPLLTGERLALNFLQRISGVATLTEAFVKKAHPVKVLDTRKTTPGLRIFERYAVRMGGGVNHRQGLYDAVLIKDNHIMAAGSITEAVKRVRKELVKNKTIEVEVTTLKEAQEALAAHADIIMLDNMRPDKIEKALKIIDKKAVTEVSGGINLANIEAYAATGVDFISIGALTHSAPAVDISMQVVKANGAK